AIATSGTERRQTPRREEQRGGTSKAEPASTATAVEPTTKASTSQAREATKSRAARSSSSSPSSSSPRQSVFVDNRPGKRERVVVASILAITLLGYLNSISGKFVYDDTFQILKNPTLRSLSNIPAMFTQGVWQFMDSSSQAAVGLYYRPIFNSLLILNFSF